MKVGDIMQPLVAVGQDATLDEVACLMLERHVGGMLVVNGAGKLAGLISEDDFMPRERGLPFSTVRLPQVFGHCLSEHGGIEAIFDAVRCITAREIMHPPRVTAAEDEPVSAVVARMVRCATDQVPVLRDGVPVGMLARHDLLRLVRQARAVTGVQGNVRKEPAVAHQPETSRARRGTPR